MRFLEKKLVNRVGMTGIFEYIYFCDRCEQEYTFKLMYKADYCPECLKLFKNEQAKERMRRYRERQKKEL